MRKITAALAAALGLAMLAPTPVAEAIPPNCVEQLWWRGEAMRFVQRKICDGPILPDGSWQRLRRFSGPAFYVPLTCSIYSCTGGYWRPAYDTGVESYPVTPATVLPDEPGHIGPTVLA